MGTRLLPGFRRRALLAAFLAYVFGVLPFLSASHSHEAGEGHEACQLCEVGSQAYAAPGLAESALAPSFQALPVPADSPLPLQALTAASASRGPPTA